jgi:xylulokinase
MLFDDELKKWNTHALGEFAIDEALLPTPLPTGSVLGQVGSELSALGFDRGALVVLGGHDHICASVGAVIDSTETVLHSTGTSEVLTTRFAGGDVALPARRWLNVESSAYSSDNLIVAFCCASGQIFKSISNVFSPTELPDSPRLLSSYDSLQRRPVFVPPIRAMQTSVTGELVGIPGVFEPEDVWQSLYEGFALECRRVLDRMEAVTGAPAQLIRSVGGQSRNDGLTQLRCNIFGLPVERAQDPNSSARGAFVVAGVACGWFDDVIAAADYFYRKLDAEVFYPDERAAERYRDFYENRYLALFKDGIDSI